MRDANRAGCFLRLGVVDLEKKRYDICIPKGREERGGWISMAEMLRNLGVIFGRKENKQEERATGRSYAEMAKRPRSRDSKTVKVEVKGEEISRNLSRLEHCLVGSWNLSSARGEDLERLGWLMVSSWGLKGKLGLEKGRALLEFEFVEEAKCVLTSGKRSVGGLQVGLERWSPRTGCLEEGETRNEAWVKILGLPISLWVPFILRRVGEVCGGFIAIDPQTKSMEELQWARILVKSNGEDLLSKLEIGVEEAVYSLSLWWEIKPSLKKASVDSRDSNG